MSRNDGTDAVQKGDAGANGQEKNFDDEKFMAEALLLAAKGRPSPNPYVGAIIVKEEKVIGKGFHKKCGKSHAEIEAINSVFEKFGKKEGERMLEGATLYITLEPCNHAGKTPPCTDAIIKAKFSRVVVAMQDENKKVRGGGIEKLKKAGVEVKTGVLEKEARELNKAFLKNCQHGMPYLTLKLALSLDGRTATKTGDSKWISGEESRKVVHKMRDKVGAVMVGIGTVLADNPHLTCRIEGGKSPLRIIVDGNLKTPLDANVLFDKNVVIACNKGVPLQKKNALIDRGAKVLEYKGEGGKFNLQELLADLAKMGIDHVMCEGGAELATELVKEELADEVMLFIAPKIIGGERQGMFGGMGILSIGDAKCFEFVKVERIGEDVMVVAKKKECKIKPNRAV